MMKPGRPRKYDEFLVPLTLSIPKALKAKIREFAWKKKKSVNEIVIELLKDYLDGVDE